LTDFEKCGDCGRFVAGEKITIDAAEFARLKLLDEAVERSKERLQTFRSRSRSPIARNPKLSSFIIRCRETMTLHQIAAACQVEFSGRTPSKSTIARFLKAIQ
jgi:hypothetical protein